MIRLLSAIVKVSVSRLIHTVLLNNYYNRHVNSFSVAYTFGRILRFLYLFYQNVNEHTESEI